MSWSNDPSGTLREPLRGTPHALSPTGESVWRDGTRNRQLTHRETRV
ncbi:MAG: hypothetical protein ICV78_14830 [Tolypothrix sp. Co-bin9]|nr:hypothetical protein [Tolypothrix sp. Co-bin9]